MNTQYKNNLKAVMNVCKKYADDKIEQALELLEDYNLSSDTVSQLSQTATAPSDVRTSSLIEVGGNCVKLAPSTASDNTVAKDKVIPENTFKLTIDKVGGMSYKSENECVSILSDTNWDFWFRFYAKPNTTYYAKVFNNNVSSPTDAKIGLTTDNNKYNYVETYYNESYSHNLTTGFSFTTGNITEGYYKLRFQFNAQKSFTGDGMIVVGSTAPTEFKPYFEGIRDSAVTSVVIKGKNLLSLQDVAETTTNGVTYKIENGVVKLISRTEGTADNADIPLCTIQLNGAYTYRSFASQITGSFMTLAFDSNNNMDFILQSDSAETKTQTFDNDTYTFKIRVSGALTINGQTMKPMLVKGSTAPTEFKPYTQPITKQIPAEVQALEGYGWGVNDTCYNYVDFNSKKFIKKVGKYTFTGNESFFYESTGRRWTISNIQEIQGKNGTSNIKTDIPNIYRFGSTFQISNSIYVGVGAFQIADSTNLPNTMTSSQVASYLAGKTIYYELETPVETDISTYLTNFNPVELNNNYASIEFVNQYNQDVPNTISFSGIIKETLVNSFTINGVTTNITDTIESDGWSASNTVFNTRKTRDRQRIKRVGKIDLGTLNWHYSSTSQRFYTTNPISDIGGASTSNVYSNTIISNNYNKTNAGTDKTYFAYAQDNRIYVYDSSYTNASDFKTAMSGVFLYYELETPVITELNVTPDFHYLALASGETITFNNTNNQPCHNTIRYSIMEEKV